LRLEAETASAAELIAQSAFPRLLGDAAYAAARVASTFDRGYEEAVEERQPTTIDNDYSVMASWPWFLGPLGKETSMRAKIESIMEQAMKRFFEAAAEDDDGTLGPELLSMHEEIEEFSRELAKRMLQGFVDIRRKQTKNKGVTCPQCGERMEWNAETEWKHGTLFGDVQVGDPYGYCRMCNISSRPLHGLLGTDRERWSLRVQEAAVDLATDESCERAVKKLARHHRGVAMHRTTALHLLHKHGALARKFVADKLATALAEAAKEGQQQGRAVELEVEHDAGMIPVATLEPIEWEEGQVPEKTAVRELEKRRKVCRWEEVKAGLVQAPGEVTGRLYTVRPTKELDEAFEDLLALACMKGWTENTSVRGVSDGARHIRPRMEDAFHACSFKFILDRPHAKQHLAAAGELLEPLTRQPKAEWTKWAIDQLEAGQADEVVSCLRTAHEQTNNDDLRKEADYFERNRDAVAYSDYRERGWSVASSEVESSHRHIVQVRIKIPGAWWHPDKVQNILALRMLKANDWWDDYWDLQRKRWRERARGFS
jgi:hypothetical protein